MFLLSTQALCISLYYILLLLYIIGRFSSVQSHGRTMTVYVEIRERVLPYTPIFEYEPKIAPLALMRGADS